MTKPAVWVQFTVKKNRVDDKNLLHLKYLTCQKLQLFFSVLRKISFHRLFCPIPQPGAICSSFEFRSYYDKSDDFEQEEPRKNMEVDLQIIREPNVGSHVSLTLSLQQFYLTEENLKMSYNLKVLPMKALEARSDTEWFG